MSEDQNPKEPTADKTIRLKHIESKLFRSFNADGVLGGVSPELNIQMVFYSQRVSIPEEVVLKLNAKGEVAEVIDPKEDSELIQVRELEANVVINLETAELLRAWLEEKIEELQALVEEADYDENLENQASEN